MTLFQTFHKTLRRGFLALVDANLRYTRIVHGDRALADGRGRRDAGTTERGSTR